MAAVLAPLSVVALWYLSTHGKGLVVARLAVWLAAVIVVLVLVAMKNPSAAGAVVSGWSTGISGFITGLGHFIGDVFSG